MASLTGGGGGGVGATGVGSWEEELVLRGGDAETAGASPPGLHTAHAQIIRKQLVPARQVSTLRSALTQIIRKQLVPARQVSTLRMRK